MSAYSLMIRMPNGEYEEHFMVVARHSKDNPREVL